MARPLRTPSQGIVTPMTDTEQTKNAPETVRNGHKAAALPKTEKKAAESRLDAIRGCIFGGAVGAEAEGPGGLQL